MFEETIDMNRIPDSVAIIMDGNDVGKRYLPYCRTQARNACC